jgi:phospholipid/cholesterol/gamma-HCH transport system permease protein
MAAEPGSHKSPPSLTAERTSEGVLRVVFTGPWTVAERLPDLSGIGSELGGAKTISPDTTQVDDWDSALLTVLVNLSKLAEQNGLAFDRTVLPEGVERLFALATAVPERKGARRETKKKGFLESVGDSASGFARSTGEMVSFLGEATIAFGALLRGKARFRRSDFVVVLQEVGADALPIVSLISLLVGLILAFVGAVQLVMFGAQIYVASLVGIAMVRVMGAIMTGIIMAGRTGAAFAAQLGTMQVNEEIDALRTLGVSPMEFLVLPRMLALMIMMPLLCLYADLMGILGGLIVGVGMLDLGLIEYYNMTKATVKLSYFWIGLFHAAVFGVLVALAGCMRGMQCGRSASAVGNAATSAVVTGIVSIIVATAIITIACNVIGI